MSASGRESEGLGAPAPSDPIAILGDLQRTSTIERLLLGREQNDAARHRLIDAIVEARPSALVLLGDLVCFGFRPSDWRRFDRSVAPIREAEIEVWPILGNHDTWGVATLGLRSFRRRFPRLSERTWYRERTGGLELVFLDSNPRRLGKRLWQEQASWFARVLEEADRDPARHGLVVFAHHPPFTNSRAVGDSQPVQGAFLPGFLAHGKTLALISGHVHAYEHFVEDGKHLIVQGSGGGPRVRLAEGESRRHLDQFEGPSPRPFCFSLLTETSTGARLEVRGFEEADRPLRTLDIIELG